MNNSKDVRDSFYFGAPGKKVFAGADLKMRLGQLEAMKDFYKKQGNQEEVERYQAEMDELEGVSA